MLPLHLGAGGDQPLRGDGLARRGVLVLPAVVDDDLELGAELLEARHHLGLVEVVGDDADLRLVAEGLVEHLEDRAARLEAHPPERLLRGRVSADEREPVLRLRGEEGGDRTLRLVALHERLRGDVAAGERDVQLARKGLAPQLDRRVLRLAVAELPGDVHEDGGHAIEELAGELGVPREVHPAELLDRREQGRGLVRVAGLPPSPGR